MKRARLLDATGRAFRLNDDDEEEWEEDEEVDEDEDGSCSEVEVEGPHFAPVFTGVLKPNGEPIIRHPIVIRMGFHPEDRKYHCPTLDDNVMDGSDRVFGWVYD